MGCTVVIKKNKEDNSSQANSSKVSDSDLKS